MVIPVTLGLDCRRIPAAASSATVQHGKILAVSSSSMNPVTTPFRQPFAPFRSRYTT